MILGVDASAVATGYAFGGPQDAMPRGGVWKTPGCDEHLFDRTLGMLASSVIAQSQVIKPKAIYLEAPFAKIDREHSEATAIALMQITGAVRAAANMARIKIHLCSVFNVRKFFIGTGFLSRDEAKPRVMAKCKALGWSFADDNEADAKATWAYGMWRENPHWLPNQPLLFDARARP
jgi:Holliday junction resolvasome RuvABC endonuclease subunit